MVELIAGMGAGWGCQMHPIHAIDQTNTVFEFPHRLSPWRGMDAVFHRVYGACEIWMQPKISSIIEDPAQINMKHALEQHSSLHGVDRQGV